LHTFGGHWGFSLWILIFGWWLTGMAGGFLLGYFVAARCFEINPPLR
jgi:uncharacterized protein YneF (UPF0154 family)